MNDSKFKRQINSRSLGLMSIGMAAMLAACGGVDTTTAESTDSALTINGYDPQTELWVTLDRDRNPAFEVFARNVTGDAHQIQIFVGDTLILDARTTGGELTTLTLNSVDGLRSDVESSVMPAEAVDFSATGFGTSVKYDRLLDVDPQLLGDFLRCSDLSVLCYIDLSELLEEIRLWSPSAVDTFGIDTVDNAIQDLRNPAR